MTVSKERFTKGEEAFKPLKQEICCHADQILTVSTKLEQRK